MDEFRSGQYLGFRVGRHEFAIDAERVKGMLPTHELIAPEVRGGPGWFAGTAALRGQKFPVVDLRLKLKLPHGTYGRNPSIVVVDTGSDLAGFLADSIADIIHVRAHEFRNGKIRIGRPREILDPASLVRELTTP